MTRVIERYPKTTLAIGYMIWATAVVTLFCQLTVQQ